MLSLLDSLSLKTQLLISGAARSAPFTARGYSDMHILRREKSIGLNSWWARLLSCCHSSLQRNVLFAQLCVTPISKTKGHSAAQSWKKLPLQFFFLKNRKKQECSTAPLNNTSYAAILLSMNLHWPYLLIVHVTMVTFVHVYFYHVQMWIAFNHQLCFCFNHA